MKNCYFKSSFILFFSAFLTCLLFFDSNPIASPLLNFQKILKIKVSGTITNESGEPLQGVSIIEKGIRNGTTTDENGSYTIKVNPDAVLAISLVGMETKIMR